MNFKSEQLFIAIMGPRTFREFSFQHFI